MQRLEHVASIQTAQNALARLQLDGILIRDVEPDEVRRRRIRKLAIMHVIQTGTVYEPILEEYTDER